jgi:hypothetical protein
MSDVNNSGSCGIQDLNEVLKDTDMTSTEKTETLSKIKNKIGVHGFVKIDKYIEVKSRVVNFTITSQNITKSKDAVVTQGTATGTLMVALSGSVTTVKVKQDENSHVEFNAITDLGVGSTTITGANITNVEYVKVYYGICDKPMKHSKYSKFNKKDQSETLTHKYNNTVVEKILDYSDFEDNLNTKEKLQKMIDLTNNTDGKNVAGDDKKIHITIDGETGSTSGKSYEMGNFSGWSKETDTLNFDNNKVGSGDKPHEVSDTDWQKSKKFKTMYWKKDTISSGGTKGGIKKKKKKKSGDTIGWNENKKIVDNINKTELDDIKENVENNSPIIEIGEGNNLDNYVLFKLKKKPKNAFFSN